MTEQIAPNEAAKRIRQSFNRMKEDLPALANVLSAFEEVLAERAAFKAALPVEQDFKPPSIDPERFRQGSPVADENTFTVAPDDLRQAAARLIPAMKKGFPMIEESLTTILEALRDGRLDKAIGAREFLEKNEDALRGVAGILGIERGVLKFAAHQLMAPFAEKRAEMMSPLPGGLQWLKGYCPLCGSWPSLSMLREQAGERSLKCSFCGHEWRYLRTACPFCENDDHEKLEFYYSEDRPNERVEVCHQCKRYVVAIDLRDRADEPVLETVPLGLIYLDILAQEKGFAPGTVGDWNVLPRP